jgi:hypothetical protein
MKCVDKIWRDVSDRLARPGAFGLLLARMRIYGRVWAHMSALGSSIFLSNGRSGE